MLVHRTSPVFLTRNRTAHILSFSMHKTKAFSPIIMVTKFLIFIINIQNVISLTAYNCDAGAAKLMQTFHHKTPLRSNFIGFTDVFTTKPGYFTIVKGDVIHLVKCDEVAVSYEESPYCFIDLPVKHGNVSKFLTPNSKVLRKISAQIPCQRTLPLLYQLNDKWTDIISNKSVREPNYFDPNLDDFGFSSFKISTLNMTKQNFIDEFQMNDYVENGPIEYLRAIFAIYVILKGIYLILNKIFSRGRANRMDPYNVVSMNKIRL